MHKQDIHKICEELLDTCSRHKILYSLVLFFGMLISAIGPSVYSYFVWEQPRYNSIYVNPNTKEYPFLQNGSLEHPFPHLNQALTFISNHPEFQTIFLHEGRYPNLEDTLIPAHTKLIGIGEKANIILSGAHQHNAAILLDTHTFVHNIALQGGKHGIQTLANADFTLSNIAIIEAAHYGLLMEKPTEDTMPTIHISRSYIAYNTSQGLYLEKSNAHIHDNLFEYNGEEALDLHVGMIARIENNTMRYNGESGIESEIGNNDLIIRNNTLEYNKKNGINIQSTGSYGKALLENNRIAHNEKYGIRCANHGKRPSQYFQTSATIQNNSLENNADGDIDNSCNIDEKGLSDEEMQKEQQLFFAEQLVEE